MFQKKVVKENKSSFPPTESRLRDEGKEENDVLFAFAAARVYEVVKKIPKGNAMTYREVAKLAGFPKAFRAVGNALNKNPNPKTWGYYKGLSARRSDGNDGKYSGWFR